MEIYKDLSNPASKEFEKLLNTQFTKNTIEEGKVIEGKINKITEKFVFLFIEGLKSEPILDINELKNMGLSKNIKIGEKISVLLEKIEDKNGDVDVSAQKAQKIKRWNKLVKCYENNELINGKESFVNFKRIGKSKLKRPFMVIDIYKGDPEKKPIVVLITRHHPPEGTGYFAFKSYLSTILNENNLSSAFLEKYRVLAFPLMNPDGVDLGHWRHNAGGIDLNRDWSVYNQKEIKTTVDFISKTLKENDSKLVLGIDFHSTYYDVFYTNEERASTSMPYFLDNWFSSLESTIPNYKVNEQPSVSKQPVSKGWFLNAHKAVGVVYEIGDDTPRDRIKIIGKESAISMMKIMLD